MELQPNFCVQLENTDNLSLISEANILEIAITTTRNGIATVRKLQQLVLD